MLAFPFLIVAVGLAAIFGPSLTQRDDRARLRGDARASCASPAARRWRCASRTSCARRSPTAPATRRSCAATSCRTCASTLLVQATVTIPPAIIGEAVLSFLGLGVQPPTPSWGVMLSAAQPFLSHGAVAGGLAGPRDRAGDAGVQPARRRAARRPRPEDDALMRAARGRRRCRCASTPTTGSCTRSTACRSRSTRRGARARRRVGLRQERDRDVAARLLPATAQLSGTRALRRRATC